MPSHRIKWEQVTDSTQVTAIAYENNKLYIKFQSGGVYRYDAPIIEFYNVRDARSKGGYVASNIKGVYKFEKVS